MHSVADDFLSTLFHLFLLVFYYYPCIFLNIHIYITLPIHLSLNIRKPANILHVKSLQQPKIRHPYLTIEIGVLFNLQTLWWRGERGSGFVGGEGGYGGVGGEGVYTLLFCLLKNVKFVIYLFVQRWDVKKEASVFCVYLFWKYYSFSTSADTLQHNLFCLKAWPILFGYRAVLFRV